MPWKLCEPCQPYSHKCRTPAAAGGDHVWSCDGWCHLLFCAKVPKDKLWHMKSSFEAGWHLSTCGNGATPRFIHKVWASLHPARSLRPLLTCGVRSILITEEDTQSLHHLLSKGMPRYRPVLPEFVVSQWKVACPHPRCQAALRGLEWSQLSCQEQ